MEEVPHLANFDSQNGDIGQTAQKALDSRAIGRDLAAQGNGDSFPPAQAPVTPPRTGNKGSRGLPHIQIGRVRAKSASVAHHHHHPFDQSTSPRGTTEADDVFCCSPTACEAPSPSFSTVMSSPVSSFSSPSEKCLRCDSLGFGEVDDVEKLSGALSLGSRRSQTDSRNGYNRRRSSTSSTGTLCTPSRSTTLWDLQDSPTLSRSVVLPKQLPCWEEADEVSEKEQEKGEEDDGKGISDLIWPMVPANLERLRYKFRAQYIEKQKTKCTFKSRQRNFDEPNIPTGWMKIVGPEGFPYFWHAKTQTMTGTWIMDLEIFKQLSTFLEEIEIFTKRHGYRREANVHLVVDMHKVDEVWWCGYYFVDHSSLSVFWHEDKEMENKEIYEIQVGELSISHMKVYTEWEYWKHWCLFPELCSTNEKIWRMSENYIRNAQTDVLTAERPATNFSFEKLKDMMSVLSEAKASYLHAIGKSGVEPLSLPVTECTWFIGRFMEPLARERFLNCYGERHARIEGMQSIHGRGPRVELKETTLLFRILSPFLFCAPEIHLKKMEMLWVDRIVYQEPWNHFFDSLSQDWTHQLVYASILLTSNIAFLTVPNVTLENVVIHGTFVQIPSYMSTIATIGSIILGLLLNKQHQNRTRSYRLEASTAPEIHDWLTKREHSTRGLEPLAVMYSLPFALLMWGMVTFLSAFTAMCFYHMTTAAIVTTAVSCVSIAFLAVWFWWMSWDSTTNRWVSICEHLHTTIQKWKPFASVDIGWRSPSRKTPSLPSTMHESFNSPKLEDGTAMCDAISVHSQGNTRSTRSLQRLEPAHFPDITLQKTRSRGSS